MCGIAGIIDLNNKIPADRLGPMLESIRHRGPDDAGELTTDQFVAGMRRLSVIDLVTGHQPIYNEDRQIVTFFNGEIYNFIELRRELIAKGHLFSTNSDTEVLVHAYEEEGIDFVRRLNGMFSFLLCDLRKQVFFLVRDHYGIKPLYYTIQGSRLIFASELKAILASGLIKASLNEESITNYLNYLYVPSPKSIYKEIAKLEAGHYLEFGEKGLIKRRWYDLNDFVNESTTSPALLREELRYLLDDAIRLQMRSDVAVGAYLSGGVDSSLITALATRHTSLPFSTFSVGFEHSEFDELPYARRVASKYGTRHYELVVTPEDAVGRLSEIMGFMDEPIGDSAILPAYLVSKLAAQHVKVALSGLGGDELFGGYSRYAPRVNKFSYLGFIPRPFLREVIHPLFSSIHHGWGVQIERLINPLSPAQLYHEKVKQMSEEMMQQLAGTKQLKAVPGTDVIAIYHRYAGSDEINQMMFTDIEGYMNDQLLQLTDRMSMANSLEARVPLLDHRLVELAVSVPSRLKITARESKLILKEVIRDLLPAEILDRPKWGFAAPYKSWTLNDAISKLIDQTVRGNLVQDGVLDKYGVEKFLTNRETVQKYSTWVWPIIALEVWYSRSKNESNSK